MSDRSFLSADVSKLVHELTFEEKVSLLSGPDWWNTNAIPRLHIPSIRMSDGPNGLRGSSHLISTPAQCIPCATSMASTFDADLVRRAGVFLGEEAKVKSASILLAPTCNIQRSPLGGRSFESFSEDPFLSGCLAAAYINGLQSQGVSATIKHFVANDQEHERIAVSSDVSERALREVYLYPFMLAQKLASPWAYMTAYNRLNGLHCCEDPALLQGILKDEWKFNGLIMSDWNGTYSVAEGIAAGVDLEMPGPPRWRTPTLVNVALGSRKLLINQLNARVDNVLRFVQKMARTNPEIVYGEGKERTVDTLERRLFCRHLASNGLVLLKNEKSILPLGSKATKIAVIGPSADGKVISGGGSAALKPSYVVTPWEGLVNNAPEGVELSLSVGCYAHKFLPTLEEFITTADGNKGWTMTYHNHDSSGNTVEKPVASAVLPDTKVRLNDVLPSGLTENWATKHCGFLTVNETMSFELGLAVAGKARVYLDGKLVIELWEEQEAGEFYYGQGSTEERTIVQLVAGQKVELLVEYTNVMPKFVKRSNMQPSLMRGFRLGGIKKIDAKEAIQQAADAASASDAAIVVVGLNADWESEGFDRASLSLPTDQDELIEAVSMANPRTIVLLQAVRGSFPRLVYTFQGVRKGSAVSMPWLPKIAGLIQLWYTGNETGNAIADVVYGKVNPAGRLPITFPAREQDIPSHLNFGSENGKVHYREGVFVGYKHYLAHRIKPLFPFGFGLSYTTFKFGDISINQSVIEDATSRIDVTVSVSNVGPIGGRQVVQLYCEYPELDVTTPRLQLKGFIKTRELAPGEEQSVTLELDKYCFSFWDTSTHKWCAKAGIYKLHVGTSCEDLPLLGTVHLKQDYIWIGL